VRIASRRRAGAWGPGGHRSRRRGAPDRPRGHGSFFERPRFATAHCGCWGGLRGSRARTLPRPSRDPAFAACRVGLGFGGGSLSEHPGVLSGHGRRHCEQVEACRAASRPARDLDRVRRHHGGHTRTNTRQLKLTRSTTARQGSSQIFLVVVRLEVGRLGRCGLGVGAFAKGASPTDAALPQTVAAAVALTRIARRTPSASMNAKRPAGIRPRAACRVSEVSADALDGAVRSVASD